jgi:glucosamine-phosphate N-acetyltransferase
MLTESPDITDDKFIMNLMMINEHGLLLIGYIGHPNTDFFEIIATGTVFIETKIIHGGSSVGHIEDIIVHDKYRAKGISTVIIESLKEYSQSINCYKVILDCSEEVVSLYKKCGFIEKGIQMAIYGKH